MSFATATNTVSAPQSSTAPSREVAYFAVTANADPGAMPRIFGFSPNVAWYSTTAGWTGLATNCLSNLRLPASIRNKPPILGGVSARSILSTLSMSAPLDRRSRAR